MDTVAILGVGVPSLILFLLIYFLLAGRTAGAGKTWPGSAENYRNLVERWARARRLDPALVAAVIEVESGWRTGAVNPSDPSFGLMQVTPIAARDVGYQFGTPEPLLDPAVNVEVGTAYLAALRDRYGIPLPSGVDAYNVGPGAWKQGRRNSEYRRKVIEAMEKYR